MSKPQQAEVRDRRRKGWFSVDDEVIRKYGPEIGVHGIAVYCLLSSHADSNEEAYPGLSYMCKTLKIGRAKLLSTLDELQRRELIVIDAGDRTHVSVYTLLDVPKENAGGGSNQNQPECEGGSNQNQRWFQREPEGGSDENRNQTQGEPNPENQSSSANIGKESMPIDERLYDDTTTTCLRTLRQIPNFPRNDAENAIKLSEYREEFPSANPVEVCRDLKAWLEEHPQKNASRLRLRNFFKTANRNTNRSGDKGPGKPRSIAVTQAESVDDYDDFSFFLHERKGA